MENKRKGITLILLSALFFSLMAAFVKSLPDIPISEKILFRNLVGVIPMYIALKRSNISFKPNNKKLLFFRCLFGLLGVGFFYTSISLMPLSKVSIINKLSPFFVMILAFFFLGEGFKKSKLASLLLALIGAVLVINPGSNFSFLPSLAGVIGAFLAASSYTIIKKLVAFDNPKLIVFYFCLSSTVVSFPITLYQGFVLPSYGHLVILLCIGFSALAAQLCMTNAYKYAAASELVIYTYANILVSSFIGFVVWSEVPSLLTLIGGIIIIIAGFINYYFNS